MEGRRNLGKLDEKQVHKEQGTSSNTRATDKYDQVEVNDKDKGSGN